MDKQATEILFTIGAATLILAFLVGLVVTLLLAGRNRRLRHRNDVLRLTADYQKELMKTQIEVVEDTLNNMSKQLHDDIGQMIALSIVQLNNIQIDDNDLKTKISEVKSSVQTSLDSVRKISNTLSTDYLKSFGIYESLEQLTERVQKATGLHIGTKILNTISFNSQSNELFTFRIIQELVTNTIKHAEATNINISISKENENIVIEYRDNGKGLDNEKIENMHSKNGQGFSNIYKRSDLMKGKIAILNSDKGLGFVLTFPNE